MSNHYCDIQLLSMPEIPDSILMNQLFSRLHCQLMPVAAGRVGVSFPHHKKGLGSVLRLHGLPDDLAALIEGDWYHTLQDYICIKTIKQVPPNVQYRTVRRIQAKSAANKRKRSVAKDWLTEEDAIVNITEVQQKTLMLPFIQLKSLSSHQMMRVFIKHGPLLKNSVEGIFSAYGLSRTTTVPWF